MQNELCRVNCVLFDVYFFIEVDGQQTKMLQLNNEQKSTKHNKQKTKALTQNETIPYSFTKGDNCDLIFPI